MAYFAAISLNQTIRRLRNTSQIFITHSDQEIIGSVYEEVKSLQEVLRITDDSCSERFNILDGQIREAIWELEDALESHVSDQFVSDSVGERNYPFVFSLDLRKVKADVDSFTEKVNKLNEYESHLKRFFPRAESIGSRFLLTTRLQEVAKVHYEALATQMRLLNEEESWDLEKIFHNRSCPPELVKAGKEIAKTCDGLPLTIVTVADILSKAKQTPEYWNDVATNTQHPIFIDAYDQTSKVIYPSYKYLPSHLKVYFLYMGAFCQKYIIPSSKLYMLWDAEGFFEPNPHRTAEELSEHRLRELVSQNVVLVCEKTLSATIKTCRLHSVFWYLCNEEAVKNKVFHVLSRYDHAFIEGIKSERRLSVRKNVLFAIKDVYDSMSSISSLRSLLCTGPYHRYPVPICSDSKMLRVLDALDIRFYQFPVEVLKLMHLRYLAITYMGKLPSSISKLWNLECLIVHRLLSIKSSEDSSHLPSGIWEMQKLKHLQITGCILPDPCGASLPNLLTLLDVSVDSCTKNVLEQIPNLKRLGIRVELAPDAAIPLGCLDHICYLQALESLKCVVVNPEIKSEVETSLASFPNLPSSLKKLSLSGFGYPWEYMGKIASLPYLEVLKLKSYAFRGPVWEVDTKGFSRLKFLLLEDTDLVHLNGDSWIDEYYSHNSFPQLKHLIIRHCYKLKKLPSGLGYRNFSEVHLKLFDCDPSAPREFRYKDVHCSWEEEKLHM